MSGARRVERYLETEKQRAFESDFLAGWERYETWSEVEVGSMRPAAREFPVTEEDVLAYNHAAGETDPLMVDPTFARVHSPTGEIVAHPLFLTAVIFYATSPDGPGSWIRTPGARNPFQRMEILEPVRIGEVLSVTTGTVDRFIRRGKHYLTNLNEVRAGEVLKARAWATLILPPDREAVRVFATA